jgi:uncharacterized protein with von Willebrand factor type A (vWA) domain
VFANFGLDQVWQQILHHTENLNRKALGKLESLTMDEEFVKRLDEEQEQQPEAEQQQEMDDMEQEEEAIDEA